MMAMHNVTPGRMTRERAIQSAEAAANMKIFKVRLPKNDGWRFQVAKTALKAAKALGVPRDAVCAATPADIRLIATRALLDNE